MRLSTVAINHHIDEFDVVVAGLCKYVQKHVCIKIGSQPCEEKHGGFFYQLYEKSLDFLQFWLNTNLTCCGVEFIDAINSSVVALQSAFAKPCPAIECLAVKTPSLRVWPALWSFFPIHTKRFHEKFNVKTLWFDNFFVKSQQLQLVYSAELRRVYTLLRGYFFL